MARRLISQLVEREQVDQIFLASDKQLRANRNSNLYLLMRLTDRSGAISAMMWNANEKVASTFETGDYVQVVGATQVYNGAMQIIATHVEKVEARHVDESEFFPLGKADLERLVARLRAMLTEMRDEPLRRLANCFLDDASFMDRFTSAPAGVKNHHAYRGGLLEHVVDLMELCAIVSPKYPEMDADLLLMAAFLHDAGKIDELVYDRQLGYTDEGQMIGHIVMAVGMLDERIRQYEQSTGGKFPPDKALRLKHAILSHHGKYEYGSPKLPMTLEAVVLHLLDNVDAKIRSFTQLVREDPATDSDWTPYQNNLGIKLYKPSVSEQSRNGSTVR